MDGRRILPEIRLPKLGLHEIVKRGHALREFAAFRKVKAAFKLVENRVGLDEIIMDRFVSAHRVLLVETRDGFVHEPQCAVEKHENELAGAGGKDGIPAVSLSGLNEIHDEG